MLASSRVSADDGEEVKDDGSSSDVSSEETPNPATNMHQDLVPPADASDKMPAASYSNSKILEKSAAALSSLSETESNSAAKSEQKKMAQTSSGSFSRNQLSETTAEERMGQTAQSFRSGSGSQGSIGA